MSIKDVRAHCYCASLVRTLFIRQARAHSRPQSPRSFWPVAGIESSGLVQHRKSAIHGLIVKSSKSDWLRIRNEYSAQAQKIGSGQSSRSLPQARRIVGSGDENGACHVIFKRAHRVENSTKYRADDLCINLVCEYFCWMLKDPHFFFGRSLSFLIFFHYTKKKYVRGKVLIISHTLFTWGRIGTWIQVCVT